jgi:hypothetical protein
MPKIRWTKTQLARFDRAVKAFNKNVRRIKRRKDVGAYAPETIKSKEIKQTITTAKELNRVVKWLNEFAEIKGKPKMYTNPHGVTMTDWQRRKTNADIRKENIRRRKETEKLQKRTVYDEHGNPIKNASLENMKYENKEISKKPENVESIESLVSLNKRLQKIAYSMNPETQLQRMRDNLIQSITSNFPSGEANNLIEKLKSLSDDELENFYLSNADTIDRGEIFISDFIKYQDDEQAESDFLQTLRDLF